MKKFIFLALIFLCGCNTNYKNFKNFYNQIARYSEIPFYDGEPQIIKTKDVESDVNAYRKKGYDAIGYSDIIADEMKKPELAIAKFAKEIGAEIVFWNQVFNGTVARQVYVHTQYYSSWVTIYVNRYVYGSVYLGKLKNVGIGVFVKDLSSEEKSQKHIADGVYIRAIADSSVASEGGMKEGDILTKVDGKVIKNYEDFKSINFTEFKVVKVEFIRDGKKKSALLKSKFYTNKKSKTKS